MNHVRLVVIDEQGYSETVTDNVLDWDLDKPIARAALIDELEQALNRLASDEAQ